jgi:hypothetical protein
MTKHHATPGYSQSPQHVNSEFWYYEEAKGLCCIVGSTGSAPRQLTIPWRLLDKTFARRQAAKAKK